MSDTHVSGGTITSPPSGLSNFRIDILNRFADDPEFTKTEYFTSNQSHHCFSNSNILGPFVRIGLSSESNFITS